MSLKALFISSIAALSLATSACTYPVITEENIPLQEDYGTLNYLGVRMPQPSESYLIACFDRAENNQHDGVDAKDKAYLSIIGIEGLEYEVLGDYFYEDSEGRTCMFRRVMVEE